MRQVRGVEIGSHPGNPAPIHGNAPNLLLRLADGQAVRLTLATPGRAEAIARRIEAFLTPTA